MEQADLNTKILYPIFSKPVTGMKHGTISRHGGVSKSPYSSNNLSYGVGDDPENVSANRKKVKSLFQVDHIVTANQIHGDHVVCLQQKINEDTVIPDCDALVTDQQGVGLMIGHADCQPILLVDPASRVVAAIHSGWRSSVANIIEKTVASMVKNYGAEPSTLKAAIGPSLGPCCAEFVNYKEELPQEFHSFQVKPDYFDFWEISSFQLKTCGLQTENIEISGICTSCSSNFFSYRRACRQGNGTTGRNGTMIARIPEQYTEVE